MTTQHRSYPFGVGAALAAAIRRINAAFSALPESRRPDVDTEDWRRLEEDLNRHIAKGERDSALLAIEAWERHAMETFAKAGR